MIKKRILLVGSNGMLGQRVAEFYRNKKNTELFCCSAEEASCIKELQYKKLDVTDKNSVKQVIKDFYPDVVINTSAYSAVDKAESEKELAWKVNVTGVEYLAKYSKTVHATLIHISSDYIFDGEEGPYSEDAKPNPVSYYGRTKLASENAVIAQRVDHLILRTNVLYGIAKHGRPDFVKWVVSSLKDGKNINIVDDQVNNPTFTDDIVYAINRAVEYKKKGIYNIAGPELLNRYEFTERIAKFFEFDMSAVKRIKTAELNQPAPRPLKSGLIILKAETELNYKPHTIEESLNIMRKELNL